MADINEWMKKVGIKQVQPSIENSPLMDRTLAQDARQNYIDNNKKQMEQRLAERARQAKQATDTARQEAINTLYPEKGTSKFQRTLQDGIHQYKIKNPKAFQTIIDGLKKGSSASAKLGAMTELGKMIGKVGAVEGTIALKGIWDFLSNAWTEGSDLETLAIDALRGAKGIEQGIVGAVTKPFGVAGLGASGANIGAMSIGEKEAVEARNQRRKVNQMVKEQEDAEAIKAGLIAQGVDPLTAHQQAYGIDPNANIPKVNGRPTNQQDIAKAQGELEALQQQKAQTDAELAKEQALYDNAKMSYENRLREIQAQKAMASSGGNNNVPPATPPVMDDNNSNNNNNNVQSVQPAVVPDVVNRVGASVGMNTQDNNNNNDKIQDVQNTEDANVQQPVVDQQPTFEEQLQQSIINPTGNLSTEELSNRLADIANQYRQTAQNHYLYNGQAIDPTLGQYNIDENRLNYLAGIDRSRNMLGVQLPSAVDTEMKNAQQLYQARMGNQLGVPYENYITAMGERRKAELDSYSQQMNQQLELAKQQATTLSEKLKYLQAQEKLRQDTALGYAKIDADVQNNIRNNQTDIAVQDLSNQGMLTDRQMRELAETDRQNRLQPIQEQKATADLIEALSWVSDPNQRAWLVMTNPDLQMRLFGRRINPQNANDINALNAFVKGSYGIDMNNMGRVNQQQGLLQNIANRIRGNN